MTLVLWWVALFGVWPFADPGHDDYGSPLVLVDLALHIAAAVVLLRQWKDREVERELNRRGLW